MKPVASLPKGVKSTTKANVVLVLKHELKPFQTTGSMRISKW